MESTAQDRRPVWEALEQHWRPRRRARTVRRASRARSISPKRNRIAGPGGRKKDFPDAERLVKRPCAALTVRPQSRCSVSGHARQLRVSSTTGWRHFSRKRTSKCPVLDLLGVSARRMLQALADEDTSSRATFCPFFSA